MTPAIIKRSDRIAATLTGGAHVPLEPATLCHPVDPLADSLEAALGVEEPWLAISDELAALRAEILSEMPGAADDIGQLVGSAEPAEMEQIGGESPAAMDLDISDDELLVGFIAEAQEHLEGAEAQLLVLEAEPGNQQCLNAVFRAFHTIKGVANMLDLRAIGIIAHEAESLLDRARSGDLLLSGPAIDAALASCDALGKLVTGLGSGVPLARQAASLDFAELIARLRQLAGKDDRDFEEQAAFLAFNELVEQEATEAPSDTASTAASDTLKVDCARMDQLIDTIGELAAAEAVVYQEALAITAAGATTTAGATPAAPGPAMEHLQRLHHLTRQLQELSASLRMAPLRGTFQKMARLARDLSKKTEKPIDFHTSGDDIELDKRMVDLVGDPLMHMIRNAIDHGIEGSFEERLAAGKPFRGQLSLRAYRQASDVYIEVEDDGQGLNREKILAKARKLGLVDQSAVLSDREVDGLVFRAGFSTADQVTDLSGRGVGMDVVKSNIEALGGSAELRSEPGRGTCFTLRLPLSLAIVDGVVVRMGSTLSSGGAAARRSPAS